MQPGSGTVGVKDLRVECVIGVYARERREPQPLSVQLAIEIDFGDAAASDDVSDTVDYDRVVALVSALARDGQYQLLESLAVAACTRILEEFPVASRVEIEIEKPLAVPDARCSYVRFSRERDR